MNTCKSCGFGNDGAPARCPRCRAWGSFAQRAIDLAPGTWNPKLLSRVKMMKLRRKSLGHPALDRLFGGGLVVGCSYLLSGEPGAGKSRMMMQLSTFFEAPLYLSGEESDQAVKLRAVEMGIAIPNLRIVETRDMELVAKNITDEYDLIILDSAHRFRTSDTNAAIGTALQAASVIALCSDIAHKLSIPALIIGHVNKDGAASGMVANEHEVDGTISITKDGKRRTLTMRKNRHGPDPISVSCTMTSAGLDDFLVIDDPDAEGENKDGMGQGLGSQEAKEESAA